MKYEKELTASTASQVLSRTRDLIALPQYWGKDFYERSSNKGDKKHSLYGAIDVAMDTPMPDNLKDSMLGYVRMNIANAITDLDDYQKFIPYHNTMDYDPSYEEWIVFFNNHKDTKHEDVIAVLDKVIEQERKYGAQYDPTPKGESLEDMTKEELIELVHVGRRIYTKRTAEAVEIRRALDEKQLKINNLLESLEEIAADAEEASNQSRATYEAIRDTQLLNDKEVT